MNGWKLATIVLAIVLICETILFGWFVRIGYQELEKEDDCIFNTCKLDEYYYYDSFDSVCYCYDEFDNIVRVKHYD